MIHGKFKLDKPKLDKDTYILLAYNSKGVRFIYSTGEKIHPIQWDKTNGAPKDLNRNTASARANQAINRQLIRYTDFLSKCIYESKDSGETLSKARLKAEFDLEFKNIDHRNNIVDVFDNWLQILRDKRRHKKTTLTKYRTVRNNIVEYESYRNSKLTFASLGSFYDEYVKYAWEERKQNNNTLTKQLNVFRTFLKWANENNFTKFNDFVNWERMSNDSEIISLTQEELGVFRDADLSDKLRLDRVRDLFVLGCYTGGRFSDYSTLSKADVYDDTLRIKPIKTGDKTVSIPLLPGAVRILEKYEYELPTISNQKFNDYLKELAKLLGVDKEIIKSSFMGKDRTDTVYKKYELITSHVARKTFVTISLESGIPAEVVMQASGHKSYLSFKRYVNISDAVTKKMFMAGWKDL